MGYYLSAVEKAVRNVARGENAQNLVIGTFQARIVKTLQEEGVIPLMLIQKGYARPLEDIRMLEELLEEKKDVSNGND